MRKRGSLVKISEESRYQSIVSDLTRVIIEARHSAVRSLNAVMTAAYWLVGRRIVEFEQHGAERANYGEGLIEKLSSDLTNRFGRGFSWRNLHQMRLFYTAYPQGKILQTLSTKSGIKILSADGASSGKKKTQTVSAELTPAIMAGIFPLPWSSYVRLLSVKNANARHFYETEALRGGWSVRQLERQIDSQFYERTALSKNKAVMLARGQKALPKDAVTPEEEIKDPFMLEFLGLKDEYSENDLEEALIKHLETFLLELGSDFCFMGRQKRLRVGDEWYRIDLLFFHRTLRSLVVIDLKIGKFSHADAGQMHLYLNYAKEHWMNEGENPPVGLILCAQKDESVARYALEGLPSKVLAATYKTVLPDEERLAEEIRKTRKFLEGRAGRGNLKSEKTLKSKMR